MIKNLLLSMLLFISISMQIIFIDNTYSIIDNGTVIMSADSIEELYSKALQVLTAFAHPVDDKIPSADHTQQAIDILSNKY